jgi:hypothetical protein
VRDQGPQRQAEEDDNDRSRRWHETVGKTNDERGARLKRIFEVHLETPQGRKEIRYVLAKSVGWGWLGYHAFLAGHRLSGFVPPILGLRDGILRNGNRPFIVTRI